MLRNRPSLDVRSRCAKLLKIDPAPVVRSIVDDILAGVDRRSISGAFHNSVADMILKVADVLSAATGISSTWPGLAGLMSSRATQRSSLKTNLPGISPEMMRVKRLGMGSMVERSPCGQGALCGRRKGARG